jgi:predicted metallopeptidase
MRSENSQTRAYARIWGLSKVWQQALKQKPAYIVEVISEKYDKLSNIEKDKVLLHELTHIPKNFSGSLVPHIRRGKRNFHRKVEDLYSRHIKQE